ncbi:phage minor head protein, partial [Campylobacter jejuni]|uniref:phage minor head protein n=1 Tax=Campylobacter jejuni TaxID=197 RepID=UPI001E4B9876
ALKVKDIKKAKALELQDIIRDAYYKGKTTDEIIDKVSKTIDRGESGLKRIARDQVIKFANAVQTEKEQKAGVSRFIWVTMGDERVR